MKRLTRYFFFLLGACAVFSSLPMSGQQTGISGVITDASGAAVAGAKVEVKQTGGGSFVTKTNAQGQYVVPSVTAAEYTIIASAPTFATAKKKILLLVGQLATVDLLLPVASRPLR